MSAASTASNAHRSPLAGKRVLVTGASGFIGSHLVHRLNELDAHTSGLARSPGRLRQQLSDAHSFVACDLRDPEQTRDTVRELRPQVVIHLAAHPDGREDGVQTAAVLATNVTALSHLLEALRELPAVSLVYSDSVKVYGNGDVPYRSEQPLQPLSTYAVSKLAGWGLVDVYRRVHGLQAVCLRPTLVYGPGQGFNLFTFLLNAIHAGAPEIGLDGGSQTRDPLFIDDTVDAFIAAAEQCQSLSGSVLPLGGGREITVQALAELAVGLMGGRQKVVCRPTCVRPTETFRSWCDNAEISQALGWMPRTSLEDGIPRTAEFLNAARVAQRLAEEV